MPSSVSVRIGYIRYLFFNSARITIGKIRGIIPFVKGQDVQCYNHSLPYSFARVPEIAIGILVFT